MKKKSLTLMIFLIALLLFLPACGLSSNATPTLDATPADTGISTDTVFGETAVTTDLPTDQPQKQAVDHSNDLDVYLSNLVKGDSRDGWVEYTADLGFKNKTSTSLFFVIAQFSSLGDMNLKDQLKDHSKTIAILNTQNARIDTKEGATYGVEIRNTSFTISPGMFVQGFVSSVETRVFTVRFLVPEKVTPTNLVFDSGLSFIDPQDFDAVLNDGANLYTSITVSLSLSESNPFPTNDMNNIVSSANESVKISDAVSVDLPGVVCSSDPGNADNFIYNFSFSITNNDITADQNYFYLWQVTNELGFIDYEHMYSLGAKIGPGLTETQSNQIVIGSSETGNPQQFIISFYFDEQERTYKYSRDQIGECQ